MVRIKFTAAALAVSAFACAAPAWAQTPAAAYDTCIQAGALLATPGQAPLAQQTVRITGSRIVDVVAGYQSQGCARVIDQQARTVLPGLIDSHVHILSEQGPNRRFDAVTKTSADRAFDGVVYAKRTLEAGFTTVADLGGDPEAVFALRDAIAAGKVSGPRIVAAGLAITPSGGHADVNGFAPEVLAALRANNRCNGADDCRRAVREAVQAGADIIKITATGGVLSNTNAGLAQQLTDEELKAIMQTAHSMGRAVVAHAHGKDGIDAALRAGVDGIEHGTYGDAESFKLYKQSGAWYVPTLLAGVTVKEEAGKPGTWMPKPVQEKALKVADTAIGTVREARKAGVKIAFGTDTGVSRHGDNAREFALLVQAGFTPAEAIKAATVDAAEHLRLSAETGRIAPGLAADIIAVDGDPTKDVAPLTAVKFVMARGTVAKDVR
ncbi:MAG: amidohydrolase family protein [Alphaproteobacteria bacterium]|nr:amidohydrolase family protein [Alphaproteobacteria bacterium]